MWLKEWYGKEGFLFTGHWHQYWSRRDLYRWDSLHLNRAGTNVLVKRFVVKPTRDQAILDLVLRNEADLIREIKVKEPLGGSDDNVTEFTLQVEREEMESDVTVLQLNKGNSRGMSEELIRIDWERSLAGKMVEQQWQEFLGLIRETQQKCIKEKDAYQ
eukprot:g43573.t1